MNSFFRLALQRQLIAVITAVLLLAYAGLIEHQVTHHAGDSDCVQCLVAQKLSHALTGTTLNLSVTAGNEHPPLAAVARYTPVASHHTRARAPPVLL